jgi:hypothetical protein
MFRPQLVSQQAWKLQFVEHLILIEILFWQFLQLAFIVQVQELIQLPFVI